MNPPFFSVILPMLNEAEGIRELLQRVFDVLSKQGGQWEIVVVDDGSMDDTAMLAKNILQEQDSIGWQILRLTRNFGHQAAYLAGLEFSRGDAVVMMDADLQDPPEVIPELVARWQEGAKLVTAVRLSRAETGFRRWCFNGFHTLFHRLTGGLMPKNSGNFGLLDRVIVEEMKKLRETNLFLPALRNWVGYEKAEVTYHRHPRSQGTAKMNWRRLTNLAWDGIASFSSVPLKMIGWIGIMVAVPSFLWSAWLLLQRVFQFFGFFRDLQVLGFTTLAVAVLALGGGAVDLPGHHRGIPVADLSRGQRAAALFGAGGFAIYQTTLKFHFFAPPSYIGFKAKRHARLSILPGSPSF